MSEPALVAPDNVQDLRHELLSADSVLPVGRQTKSALADDRRAKLVSTRELRGIIEYEPSEFTFTAWAGTPLAEIAAALSDCGQYLPFDPVLMHSGATIGGTVAAGLSGPGRFRFGGIRDFVLGVQFLTGSGETINGGGKVVKNAAGFDLPKFLVGSLGRLGIITQVTFKVFPRPASTRTFAVACESLRQALDRISLAASSRWELDAIDLRPARSVLYCRVAGPDQVVDRIGNDLGATWGSDVHPIDDADTLWGAVRELRVDGLGDFVVKVPTTPTSFQAICELLPDDEHLLVHGSAAANITWLMFNDPARLGQIEPMLQQTALSGIVVKGECRTPRIGRWTETEIESVIKQAFDPDCRFPSF